MRNEDLHRMNRRIAKQCRWDLPGGQAHLDRVPCCIARPLDVALYSRQLQSSSPQDGAASSAGALNKEYLEFLRLRCAEILRGDWHLLVVLHVSVAQAQFFAELADDDLGRLAREWNGPIFEKVVGQGNGGIGLPVMIAQRTAPGVLGGAAC